jgi:cysteinyl-tRNA synthetase
MAQTIYNTLTRHKEPFEPKEPGHVRMYVCGPTVYDLSHIGHARVYVAFDVISRALRRQYKVTYVRNYTDVDDKIIKRAKETHVAPQEVSERYIAAFEADMKSLGCAPPDVSPKVTETIDDIIKLIETLIDKGIAYVAGGDVMYAVGDFADYGKLSKRSLEDMEAGARVEVNTSKRHPMDFVLWKAAKPDEPKWSSPWGDGRPGWHIECSAMSHKFLGDGFDLHGGGRDLIFPHHENEIAQSEAAYGGTYAHAWLHNGMVNIDNEKMSKSLGNFFTIAQVLEKFDAQTLRYYLIATHYRSPINFSDASLKEAEVRVRYFYDTLAKIEEALAGKPALEAMRGQPLPEAVAKMTERFDNAMADDFNTPQAIGDLSDVFKAANDILSRPKNADQDAFTLASIHRGLKDVGSVLGLFVEDPKTVLGRIDGRHATLLGIDPKQVQKLIDDRLQARRDKNFAQADALRAELLRLGVIIKDGPDGTSWHVG